MSDVITEPRPVETVTGPEDLDHIVCDCDEDLALCGLRLPEDTPFVGEDLTNVCIDCLVRADVPCPRCGE